MQRLKLDIKNNKLLIELTKNSRNTSSQLAKSIGLSRQAIDYRIGILLKKGIVTSFIAEIDLKKLNYEEYGFFCQLNSVDEKVDKQINQYVSSNPFMGFTGEGSGKWNIFNEIVAKNSEFAETIMIDFLHKFEDYITQYKLYPVMYYNYMPIKHLQNYKNKTRITDSKIKIDKKDVVILKMLNQNARAKLTEIAYKMDITANSVKNRIKNMIGNGIIKGFTANISTRKLGYTLNDFLIRYDYSSHEEKKKFISFLEDYPHIIYVYQYLGEWNFEIGLVTKQVEEIKPFLMELRGRFRKKVHVMELHTEINMIKDKHVPDGVFDDLMKRMN